MLKMGGAAISALKNIAKRISLFAFEPLAGTPMTRAHGIFLAVLFLAGLVHWGWFMQADGSFYTAGDWAKECTYFTVLQEAVQTGCLPYHVSSPLSSMGTPRFLAIPETLSPLWPPVLLLAFLDVPAFILANTLILYGAGFAGCLLIRNRYRLSPFVFFLLFALFNFNGYLTAHLACGHAMWVGYFFLPLIAYFLLKILEEQEGWSAALWLAASLCGMMLQGAFHMFIWCLLFLALVLIGTRRFRARAQILAVILLGTLLSFLRLWPALLLGDVSRGVEAGYNSWGLLLDALVSIQPWSREISLGIFFLEYDFYISAVGLIFILIFGIGGRFYRDKRLDDVRYPGLDLALLVMLVLAAGNVYQWLAVHIPVNLLAVERVPSRFLVLPFIFLLVVACIRAQRIIPPVGRRPAAAGVLLAAAVALLVFLLAHSYAWRACFAKQPATGDLQPAPHIVRCVDPPYMHRLQVGALVSLLTVMGLTGIWLMRRTRLAAGRRAAVKSPQKSLTTNMKEGKLPRKDAK